MNALGLVTGDAPSRGRHSASIELSGSIAIHLPTALGAQLP